MSRAVLVYKVVFLLAMTVEIEGEDGNSLFGRSYHAISLQIPQIAMIAMTPTPGTKSLSSTSVLSFSR